MNEDNLIVYFIALCNIPKKEELPVKSKNEEMISSRTFTNFPLCIRPFYKSAGVFSYHKTKSNTFFLMGLETRGSGQKKKISLSEFLGKREDFDLDAEHTALREFHEESNYIYNNFAEQLKKQIYQENTPKVWNSQGKSVYFFLEVPYTPPQDWTNFPNKPKELNKLQTKWVPIGSLLKAIHTRSDIIQLEPNEMNMTKEVEQFEIFRYTLSTLYTYGVLSLLQDIEKRPSSLQ